MDDLKLHGAKLAFLVQTVRIFYEDIQMSFGLDNFSGMEMKRGQKINSMAIELHDDQHIDEEEMSG